MAAFALGAIFAGLWAIRPAPDPRDLAVSPLPPGPLRLVVFGTSLSAPPQTWPDDLAGMLSVCRHASVKVIRVAEPGRGSAWALDQLERVIAAKPDLVLIEFAINDANLRTGARLARAYRQHLALIAALRAGLPDGRLVVMTMSPATGLRGWIRPFLASHYAQYHDLAVEAGIGLVDLYPRWLALPPAQRGLEDDGLHPAPDLAAGVIVPAVVTALGGLQRCL